MMFTCAPLCANPAHGHARLRRTGKSAATKVVKNRRGKLVCVDLHCHYLNPDVAAKVAHLNPAQYEPCGAVRERADARGQREADAGPRAEALDDRGAAEGHGPHGHRHPGGVAGAEPDLLLDRGRAGRASSRAR